MSQAPSPLPSSSSTLNDSAPVDPAYGRTVMLMAFAATSSTVAGVSSIMPLVPHLTEVFGVSHATASLIITAFTLPGIFFAPLAGVLADRYGRQNVLSAAHILFFLAGLGCAFAPNFATLVFLRFIQGIGAAPLGVLNTTIIADTFPGKHLARYVGYNMSVLSVCTALYPTIGGLLGSLNWRYSFLLSLVSLPAIFLSLRTPLANPGAGTTLRQYLAGAAEALRNSRILALFGMTLITFTLLYGPIITCFPVLAHNNFDASPALIGSAMFFASVGSASTAALLGRLSARFAPLHLLLCSQIFYVCSLLALPFMPKFWWLAAPIMFYGFGQGLNIPNIQAQLLHAVPAAQRASVMAVNGMLLRIGQTIGPFLFSAVMVWQGTAAGFYAGALLAVGLSLLAIIFLRRKS